TSIGQRRGHFRNTRGVLEEAIHTELLCLPRIDLRKKLRSENERFYRVQSEQTYGPFYRIYRLPRAVVGTVCSFQHERRKRHLFFQKFDELPRMEVLAGQKLLDDEV